MIGRLARVLCRSISGIRTVGIIAALTLVAAGGAALCPTPDTGPLSSAALLSPGNSSQLSWAEAPQDTVARYRCDPGYLPVGTTERTCRGDGTWSGAAPRCQDVELYTVPSLGAEHQSRTLPSIREIRFITRGKRDLDGVSRQQCWLPPSPVVSDDDPAISWAAGPLCYHLFTDRLSRAAAATLCRQLGPSGQLVRLHSSGVHSIAQLVLRQLSLANRWAHEFIWTAGEDQDDEQTRNAEAPSQCGSPAVGSGQRYEPPPSPDLLAANVTCAGYSTAEGAVFCREGRWTPADFCPTDGLLGTALGAVAGVILLLGCVLLAAASYMRHKRDNESGWETYTYIRRLSRLSRYGGRRHELAANLVTDNAYSSPMTAADSSKSPVGTSGGSPRASWLYGQPAARRGNAELLPPPPPSSSPLSSAGLVNPHYRAPSASDQPPPTAVSPANLAVEYSVPLVQGQRQSPKLSFAGRPGDGAVGDEYAVPYDARGQVSERTGAPPDVVTSTGGM
ncbi:hypothetical protein FJT64_009791 [Amphibalanus amphitrite]|uniref:Sushi domain-containing protein n=1 Tax=Amphibalanus amphitrite TaxID=1232801 RepID=A0A6A4VF93_AMPAM|nr:hypothetical protein FJT64_009791 [Amphibalanus amphitrite]